MSTFVSLAADNESTLCAVATGDWLLQVIKTKRPEQMDEYCAQFVSQFTGSSSSGEQRLMDAMSLLTMFLAHEDAVFQYLYEAREKGEIAIAADFSQDPNAATNASPVPLLKKTFVEVYKEVEEFFTVLMSILVLRIDCSEVAGKIAGDLCNVFKNSYEMPEFRLKLLQTLYNVFRPEFPYRFPIFVSTLEYAAETNQFHVMLPYIKYINEWMKDWNLTASSKRQVYLILANQLKKIGKTEEAYLYLKQHIIYFQGENETVLGNGATISAAVELVEDSISLHDIMYFDTLLELDAVKYLKQTSHRSLVDLLEVFISGGTAELKKIQQRQPNLFEEHGLNYDDCFKKIQLLSLVTLAESQSTIEISHISSTLNLSSDEAEELIAKAIGQGLLDAKIDQMNKIIHVRSTMQREFGRAQWENLHSRLETWIDGVRNLINIVNHTKSQHSDKDAKNNIPANSIH